MPDSPSSQSGVQTWVLCRNTVLAFVRRYSRAGDDKASLLEVTMKVAATCGLLSGLWMLTRRRREANGADSDASARSHWQRRDGSRAAKDDTSSTSESVSEKQVSSELVQDQQRSSSPTAQSKY
jgi:hypothetical protein